MLSCKLLGPEEEYIFPYVIPQNHWNTQQPLLGLDGAINFDPEKLGK